MIFELRQYQVYPGKMSEWVQFFTRVILPFQRQKGAICLASFVSQDDPDQFIWIRGLPEEMSQEDFYQLVYEDPTWKQEIAPHIGQFILENGRQVTSMTRTDAH